MAASSAPRTQGACETLTFALLVVAALLSGEYFVGVKKKEAKNKKLAELVNLERPAGRFGGGGCGRESGRRGGVFV